MKTTKTTAAKISNNTELTAKKAAKAASHILVMPASKPVAEGKVTLPGEPVKAKKQLTVPPEHDAFWQSPEKTKAKHTAAKEAKVAKPVGPTKAGAIKAAFTAKGSPLTREEAFEACKALFPKESVFDGVIGGATRDGMVVKVAGTPKAKAAGAKLSPVEAFKAYLGSLSPSAAVAVLDEMRHSFWLKTLDATGEELALAAAQNAADLS